MANVGLYSRYQEVTEPSKEAFRWMATLPASVRPMELAKNYPRIVNNLALYWRHPGKCEQYLSQLILDKNRSKRTGFSFVIAAEILRLHTYFTTVVDPRPADEHESMFNFKLSW